MRLNSEQSGTAPRPSTLGRLGGLSAPEADRGERALWLAGDGYRAALFHLGALTRLNELGLLAQVSTVGAVSGGSILAALLATRVPWPLHGAYREWREQVVLPLRAIARRNARARAFLRKPFPGAAAEAALEERYARELVEELGGVTGWGPNFVFGASGLALSGLAAGWEECVEWEIDASAHPPGYPPALVERTIAAVRTDLDAFGEAEQAVLENHGYLLADAALRARGLVNLGGLEGLPPEPPHPRWMDEQRVREALSSSSRRKLVGRLRPRRARRSGRVPEAGSHDREEELLERHRPFLRYDSLESLRADPVSTICSFAAPGRCNSLHRADGTLIASVEPSHGEARLSLDFLGGALYGNGDEPRRGDYLDACGGSHAADALELRRRGSGRDVVYGRTRRDAQGRLWLQYWLFFYYAEAGFLGLDRHEGDWQVFQIRLGGRDEPEAATYVRRSEVDCLRWDQVDLVPGEDGPAPVVRPARGSHAPLPRAGSFAAPVVPDHNDGQGPLVRPGLDPIADEGPGWVLWPGRWGSTRRREWFEGESPRGPREHPCWWDPGELHDEGRPWEGSATGRELGEDRVPAVSLETYREEDLAVVSYAFDEFDAGGAEPARIVAAPLDAAGEVGVARSFPVEGWRGSFAVQLAGEREWHGLRACAASQLGVPGACATAAFADGK
ncbi:MAG TPA: hypothetical protein VFJ76_03505 [Solirubrobacterales bacterium]|nr:hypothetical protein [Solirubrobacterales bacterium]